MQRFRGSLVALAALTLATTAPGQQTSAPSGDRAAGYLPHADLGAALQQLAATGPQVMLDVLARTTDGRDVWVVSIAGPGETSPEHRQAVLLVGGVTGDDPTGSAVCLGVARRLVAALDDTDDPLHELLATRRVFVVPRLNPDGIERVFGRVWHAAPHNARAVDHDRDGILNEDGVNDLDGDGVISIMRIPDPHGGWLVDEQHPRLMRPADADAGLRGTHRLELESIDDDADGRRNEDGSTGVNVDRNWPHFFQPGNSRHGIHQLSEPECRGLAQFVVDHPQITLAIVYGRHDNLVEIPKGKARGADKQSYRDLHPDDVKRYEHIAKTYKEQTGLGGSDGSDPEGALYGWLYSHQAITTFAVRPWYPLDRKQSEDDPAASQPASQPTTQEAADEPDDEAATAAPPPPERGRRGGPGGRGGRGGPPSGGDSPGKSDDPLADRVRGAKWLTYSDTERDAAGFVEWHPFTHPTLGEIEIGGFAPYFHTLAPADELDGLVEAQAAFLGHAAGLLPDVRAERVRTEDLGADLWRVKLTLVNHGYLPTHTGIAEHTRQPALVLRPDLPAERIVGGQRAQRVRSLAGSGGAADAGWLVRGKAGDTFTIRVYQRSLGTLEVPVTLTIDNGEGQ